MSIDFEPSYLGAHSHELPRGPRVRLRLIQIRDRRAIQSFLAAHRVTASELQAARLATSDPQELVAICATAFLGAAETVVGVGAMDVGAVEPDLLVVDAELTEGLDDLLTLALLRRAETIADRRAA